MKILFVLENYLPHIGGVEIVFKNLCEGLAKKGHDVTIVTHQLPKTKKRETINGVKVVRVPCNDSRYLFTFLAVPTVYKLAKKADVIHSNTPNGGPPAWLVAKLLGKPVILHVHEVWVGRWQELSNFSPLRAFLHDLLERLTLILPYSRYSCVSESTAKELRKAIPWSKRIRAIHNGFDPTIWKKPRTAEVLKLRKKLGLEKSFVIHSSGRPGTTKGFEYLIKAFPKIKKEIPNAKLVLMLSKEKQYVHKIEEYKEMSDKDVIFVEPVQYKELPVWKQMADCNVVPSTTEGFGYAVIESSATGKPVVASDTASIPEVIYGKHLLVKSKSPTAIAKALVQVSKGKYKTSKEKSFPWSRNILLHEKLYKELIR